MIAKDNHRQDRLVRGADAIAKVVGCSRRNIYELVKRGLPARKLNGPTSPLVARRSELLAWLERELEWQGGD